jgi:hypothetical protein
MDLHIFSTPEYGKLIFVVPAIFVAGCIHANVRLDGLYAYSFFWEYVYCKSMPGESEHSINQK